MSELDDLRRQVEKPVGWKPEPGETAAGTLSRWEQVTIQRPEGAKTCDVAVIQAASGGELAVWCWHTALKQDLVGKAGPGDLVAVHFEGKVPKKSGEGSYAKYRVAISKQDAPAPGSQSDDIPY